MHTTHNSCEIPFGQLLRGTFVRRDNRFRVQVNLDGRIVAAHLPNSGRLGELLAPNYPVWVSPADPATLHRRRTAYTLALVELEGRVVSVNSQLPGDLVEQAIRCGRLKDIPADTPFRREVPLGESRIDYWLAGREGEPPCWLEVKSVTLVENGVARFPDAPTTRGRRHLNELIHAVHHGERAMVVFVIQRDDAKTFSPNDPADPAFGETLRQAAGVGVEIHAYVCHVTHTAIQITQRVPVRL